MNRYKESNDVRLIALRCIVYELSACENSAEFPAESGCKANLRIQSLIGLTLITRGIPRYCKANVLTGYKAARYRFSLNIGLIPDD